MGAATRTEQRDAASDGPCRSGRPGPSNVPSVPRMRDISDGLQGVDLQAALVGGDSCRLGEGGRRPRGVGIRCWVDPPGLAWRNERLSRTALGTTEGRPGIRGQARGVRASLLSVMLLPARRIHGRPSGIHRLRGETRFADGLAGQWGLWDSWTVSGATGGEWERGRRPVPVPSESPLPLPPSPPRLASLPPSPSLSGRDTPPRIHIPCHADLE